MAAAIVSIVSVMLVFALYTMGAIGARATDVVADDATLSEQIALDDETLASSTPSDVTLNPEGSDNELSLTFTFNTYTTSDGRSFTVFEYTPPSGAGS